MFSISVLNYLVCDFTTNDTSQGFKMINSIVTIQYHMKFTSTDMIRVPNTSKIHCSHSSKDIKIIKCKVPGNCVGSQCRPLLSCNYHQRIHCQSASLLSSHYLSVFVNLRLVS